MVATAAAGAGRRIDAVSADARLVDLLDGLPAEGRGGLVHSVHDKVVNLLTPDGLLCCLSTDALDDAPRTIRLPATAWARLGWRDGDAVAFSPGELRHRGAGRADDGTTVVLAGAARWQPPAADLSAVDVARLRHAADVLAGHLVPPAGRCPFEEASAAELARRTGVLGDALRATDVDAAAAAMRALIGLGAGLTPSGDDILTGLAVVAAASGSLGATALTALLAAVMAAPALETRTTAVSAATLAEAADGRARQRVHDLVATIAAGADDPTLAAAAQHVRAIGHSSGADVLTGVRLGLVVEADLREEALLARIPTHPKETL
ncbi:hypothetical protein GCM10022237_01260 [Nocardioides ginsengisoli]|uniref:DUF2877 domain-containing protein n=1 Tax=Nocardioides ginsengisoli TaxID=363868 RepID=A0ABW3W892_9ACTN